MKNFSHLPSQKNITNFLSHQRGLYDLRCGWNTIFFDFLSFWTVFWTIFDRFGIILVQKWKKKIHPPTRKIIANFLNYQRGLYDLTCGWDTILFDFWSFWTVFRRFSTVLDFFSVQKWKKILSSDAKNYYGFFKLSTRSLRVKMWMGPQKNHNYESQILRALRYGKFYF